MIIYQNNTERNWQKLYHQLIPLHESHVKTGLPPPTAAAATIAIQTQKKVNTALLIIIHTTVHLLACRKTSTLSFLEPVSTFREGRKEVQKTANATIVCTRT